MECVWVFFTGQLATMGLEQKYQLRVIKVFTYPEKQLVREFENFDNGGNPCVSTAAFSLALYHRYYYIYILNLIDH